MHILHRQVLRRKLEQSFSCCLTSCLSACIVLASWPVDTGCTVLDVVARGVTCHQPLIQTISPLHPWWSFSWATFWRGVRTSRPNLALNLLCWRLMSSFCQARMTHISLLPNGCILERPVKSTPCKWQSYLFYLFFYSWRVMPLFAFISV